MGPTASGSSELLFSVLPFNVSLYMSFRTLLISEIKRKHMHFELTTSIREQDQRYSDRRHDTFPLPMDYMRFNMAVEECKCSLNTALKPNEPMNMLEHLRLHRACTYINIFSALTTWLSNNLGQHSQIIEKENCDN